MKRVIKVNWETEMMWVIYINCCRLDRSAISSEVYLQTLTIERETRSFELISSSKPLSPDDPIDPYSRSHDYHKFTKA